MKAVERALKRFLRAKRKVRINIRNPPDGKINCFTPRQVADLLGHSTSQITEMYYVKRDNSRLIGITDSFEI